MMTSTYKIMDITKDKQLIGQEIKLTKKCNSKNPIIRRDDLNEALKPIIDTLAILIARGK
jgi:hypothetical protein